jgi:hypothetical protein
MRTVALLVKIYNSFQLKQIDAILKAKLEGLKVVTQVVGIASRGWVQITVSGEDEKVALHYLDKEIGVCPTSLEDIGKFSAVKGRITALNQSRNELCFDVGIFSPEIVDATIPLWQLQAQLVDGRKVALKKLAELFGFCENMPLMVEISGLGKDGKRIETVLAEKQLMTYRNWTSSLLDRLMILGASFNEVESAVKSAGFERDVVDVETLGMFEFAVVCKLGTDAVGLIPRVGRTLRNATLATFSSRRIRAFLESSKTA